MKAYQVRIEIEYSEPRIWRRVIMPADATFNRLHDVIQNVFNFRSGYPSNDCHLFEFDLTVEELRVTNDEEAYQVYQEFKKNRRELESRLKALNSTFAEQQLKNLRTVIRKPTGLKIDQYLEKYGELRYIYDFGDDWRILITLEDIVGDYRYGYPTLLDGAETAPPEDVGGLPGFYEFLEIYHDPDHPDYADVRTWAKGQRFKEYDPDHINDMLKFIKYKKTEGDRTK